MRVKPEDPEVEVVANALAAIFGKESVSIGINLRARQIVHALDQAGMLARNS